QHRGRDDNLARIPTADGVTGKTAVGTGEGDGVGGGDQHIPGRARASDYRTRCWITNAAKGNDVSPAGHDQLLCRHLYIPGIPIAYRPTEQPAVLPGEGDGVGGGDRDIPALPFPDNPLTCRTVKEPTAAVDLRPTGHDQLLCRDLYIAAIPIASCATEQPAVRRDRHLFGHPP